MDFDCLSKGIITDFACGDPIDPVQGAVFAPYVMIGFKGEGSYITVGNKSSGSGRKADNHAVIKSFEYGFSEGAGVKVEILDEEGSSVSKFLDRLSKSICDSDETYKMFAEFGWIIQDCEGRITYDTTSNYGRFLYFMPMKIDVSYNGGAVKYTVEGVDFKNRMAETRLEETKGTDADPMHLKNAIETLFADNCPKITDIRWQNKLEQNWEFKNSDGGKLGPAGVWNSDQQNVLSTVRKWLAPLTTYNDKGVVFQWKNDEDHACLVIMEDITSGDNENDPCCQNNIGTYIVNGGNCSNVLQFSPQISWTLATEGSSGGGGGGGANPGGAKMDATGERSKKGGSQTTVIPNNSDVLYRSPDNLSKLARDANIAHEKAVKFREVPSSIEAELKLMGDPKLAFPFGGAGLVGKSVSIIVMNPFYIRSGSWLAEPPCNETLTNKKWMINGANHQIKEGSFVTTLKVRLDVPGPDLPSDDPMGGQGCGIVSFGNTEDF